MKKFSSHAPYMVGMDPIPFGDIYDAYTIHSPHIEDPFLWKLVLLWMLHTWCLSPTTMRIGTFGIWLGGHFLKYSHLVVNVKFVHFHFKCNCYCWMHNTSRVHPIFYYYQLTRYSWCFGYHMHVNLNEILVLCLPWPCLNEHRWGGKWA